MRALPMITFYDKRPFSLPEDSWEGGLALSSSIQSLHGHHGPWGCHFVLVSVQRRHSPPGKGRAVASEGDMLDLPLAAGV